MKDTYRVERGYYMADRYFHGWRIDVQDKRTLNWETIFKCKTASMTIKCLEKLEGDFFYCGYGKTKEEIVEILQSK